METKHDLDAHISATYRNLRRGLAILALAFPFVIWNAGYFWNQITLLDSISAYYHTSARNIFVGVLCTVGGFLYLYKGYTDRENIALNIAGLCALGVAFFPTDPSVVCVLNQTTSSIARLHGVFAVVFFLAIAYVCIFLSSQKLSANLSEAEKPLYRRIYRFCGGAMVICVLLGVGSLFLPASMQATLCRFRPIFIVETAAILIFSIYWITKSNEIDHTVSWLPWK